MFNNPIPKFSYIDNKLIVVKPGFIEDFALYEGNRIVLKSFPHDSTHESAGGVIAIQNKNTTEIMLGTYFGGHLVVIPSFHPVSEKHWKVIGNVIAVERRMVNAYVGKEHWYISSNKNEDEITDSKTPVSSIYLSEYAKAHYDESISLLASTSPIKPVQAQLKSDIPGGCIWFLIPELAVQSDKLPKQQRWSILGRQRRCSKWKQKRKSKPNNVFMFPLSFHNEKNTQEVVQGGKLASK